MIGTDTGAEGGSTRRLATSIGVVALLLTVLALLSPVVSITQAACPATGCPGGDPGDPTMYTLTVHINGVGQVKKGIAVLCEQAGGTNSSSTSCDIDYVDGTSVTLGQVPGAGYAFQGWTGDCSGSSCQQTMSANHSVTATFADSTPPGAPSITGPTDGQVIQSTAGGATSVSFDGDGTSTYVCRMDVDDPNGAGPCGSPWGAGALSTAQHTAYVWAKDVNGNVSTAASRTFKVVNLPDTSLAGTPVDGAIVNTRPTAFTYASPTGTTFLCTLDGVNIPCNADVNPADGFHSLAVRAGVSPFDSTVYADPTPATRIWTVDTHAPNTAVTSAPPAKTSSTSVSIPFAGADPAPGTALHFECKLDTGAFKPCSSPATYTALAVRTHTFTVKAIDAAGNADSTTPATATWTVVRDADNDGYDVPQDCNDNNTSISPGAPEVLDNDVDENCDGVKGVNLDRDGDGVQRPADCDDANAGIKPGAYDKPGDAVDQDCSGSPADYQRPGTSLSSSWAVIKGRTVFPVFKLSGAPAGAKVTVSCKGKGCKFKRKPVKLVGGRADLRKLMKKLKLGKGAVVDVRTVVPDMLVSLIRVKVGEGGAARTTKLCTRPGTTKTFSCG